MDKDVVEQGSDVRCVLEPDLTLRAEQYRQSVARDIKVILISSQLTIKNHLLPFSASAIALVIVVIVVAYFAVFPSNQLAVHVRDRLKGDRHVIVATSAKGTIGLVNREATVLAHVLLLKANNVAPNPYLEVTL